jgi:hypothetical protein
MPDSQVHQWDNLDNDNLKGMAVSVLFLMDGGRDVRPIDKPGVPVRVFTHLRAPGRDHSRIPVYVLRVEVACNQNGETPSQKLGLVQLDEGWEGEM